MHFPLVKTPISNIFPLLVATHTYISEFSRQCEGLNSIFLSDILSLFLAHYFLNELVVHFLYQILRIHEYRMSYVSSEGHSESIVNCIQFSRKMNTNYELSPYQFFLNFVSFWLLGYLDVVWVKACEIECNPVRLYICLSLLLIQWIK